MAKDDQVFIVTDTQTGDSFTARTKWGVSRGRETYGYNICSLYVDGSKVASCNGGGYDMVGTVIADLITARFQDRLNTLDGNYFYDVTGDKKKGTEAYKMREPSDNNRELYGLSTYRHENGKRRSSIDGACGLDSVRRIAEAIGVRISVVR